MDSSSKHTMLFSISSKRNNNSRNMAVFCLLMLFSISSTSLCHVPGGANSKRYQPLPRISSSRARSITNPLLPPQQLVIQDVNIDEWRLSIVSLFMVVEVLELGVGTKQLSF
ncbi:hypothetical protein QVD17_41017 [Tagetes erecta]|uniref:Uncharacterized protein n=1 Tax=Tagetes erecta TaxID=13708 RepID=A0AAD8NGF3_TARER|nr:hypothetical protein QVD17_41017 [Tagetes erecta]